MREGDVFRIQNGPTQNVSPLVIHQLRHGVGNQLTNWIICLVDCRGPGSNDAVG